MEGVCVKCSTTRLHKDEQFWGTFPRSDSRTDSECLLRLVKDSYFIKTRPDMSTVMKQVGDDRYEEVFTVCTLQPCHPAAFCLVSLCVRLALRFIHTCLQTSNLIWIPSGPVAHVISLQNKCVWVHVGVHPNACEWDKLCVCASVFLFTLNSDLISQSQNVPPWDRKLCWSSEFITRGPDQRKSLEKNQTNLYIYESGIHFTAYITPALSPIIPMCYSSNMSS